ncbi:FMN-linked oxidoreductase [Schizopora paradoxa]|uniref:Dihydroorotate oxidase n=1 Tax=Schizopora paradoxa TaxID=27342 RepID=A0A0H2STI2_9AGAM|nr:FMN-linked oxidoreductase [Schizopora paradoxa]
MANIRRITISPALMNSSSAWASEKEQIVELYECEYTGAVTTRTATLHGFQEDLSIHTVAFASSTVSSVNSYGYSPHPLSQYLTWVEELLKAGQSKPFIISITSSDPEELSTMIDSIQQLRRKVHDDQNSASKIAIEINTSCPNIAYAPPPAYAIPTLKPFLNVLVSHFSKDRTLVIGLKLPPYVVSTQMSELVGAIEELTVGLDESPIAFLTCTNTLGVSLLFADQAEGDIPRGQSSSQFALPTPLGGLAGDSLHALALGNVYTFRRLISASQHESVRNISIVGVGGVTNPDAVKRMREAGANVVACATIFGKLGIDTFKMLSG